MVDVVIEFDICGRQAAICRWLLTIRVGELPVIISDMLHVQSAGAGE